MVCLNTNYGVSNTNYDVSNTDSGVSNTTSGVSNTDSGVSNTDSGVSAGEAVGGRAREDDGVHGGADPAGRVQHRI